MKSVNRFESNLLRILRCFLGDSPLRQALPLMLKPLPRPECLSRDCVDLVEQTLSVGTTKQFASVGGWYHARHLRNEQSSEGRVWDRTPPTELGLQFSRATLDFLIWITSADLSVPKAAWAPRSTRSYRDGDVYFFFRVSETLRGSELFEDWYKRTYFRTNPLIALMSPDEFAEAQVLPEADFSTLSDTSLGWMLEAMQDVLANRLVEIERSKANCSRRKYAMQLGMAQHAAITKLMDACEANGRRDLCGFLFESLRQSVTDQSETADWIGKLPTNGLRIADRAKLYEHATTMLRIAKRLSGWQAASLSVGYFDENYAESQLLKLRWEEGQIDEPVRNAARIVDALNF